MSHGTARSSRKRSGLKTRVQIGSELAAFSQRFGGVDLDISRDQTPTETAAFE